MSYPITRQGLVDTFAQCLVRHESEEGINDWLQERSGQPGIDLTITPEFMVQNELWRHEDREAITAEAQARATELRKIADLTQPMASSTPPAVPVAMRVLPAVAGASSAGIRPLWLRILLGLGLSFLIALGAFNRLNSLAATVSERPPMPPLEALVYRVPGAAFSTVLSPFFLPSLAYPGMFRESTREFGELQGRPVDGSEGLIWGLVQSAAFYVPIVFLRRRRSSMLIR